MSMGHVIDAIRNALLNNAGVFQTVPAGVYGGEYYEGLGANEAAARAMVKPRIEISTPQVTGTQGSPPITGSFVLVRFTTSVRVIRFMDPSAKLDDTTRDAYRGLAADDAIVFLRCLTTPRNLTEDSDGVPTGLVSGCLQYAGSDPPVFMLGDSEPGRIETSHKFTGIVKLNIT